jgi:NAD(P)H-hydrate epimerase
MVRLTRAQVREVDRRAIEEYHIPGIVLMENAARAVVDVATEMLDAASLHAAVVLCGGGNNGGDGLAVARHLHNRGLKVVIQLLADPEKCRGDARANWEIVRTMGLQILPTSIERLEGHLSGLGYEVLFIDAVYGTGLQSAPRSPFEQWVGLLESFAGAPFELPVLAVDLPSGLDCDSGRPLGPCIRATKTVTFVAEKAGFANPGSKQYTGEVVVGDIGCPRELIEEVARVG